MVDGLLLGKFGNWRQDSLRIAGQEDDVLGVRPNPTLFHILQVINRETGSSVLSQSGIVEIELPTTSVKVCVLDQRAKLYRVVNLWFDVLHQIVDLCVTPSFKVENALRPPANFVVPDNLYVFGS